MGNSAAHAHVPRFEHYTITRVLGEGGMGVVYEAQDRRTELPVAVKVMSRHRLSDPDLQRRFLKENEILASLNHRNIVRCYEITRSLEGMPSIVMEYLDGVDFRAFEGRPYTELLPLMIQALMGLNYLKQRNILHRDLSSNNILVVLERGKRLVKIVDFGVAKILDEVRAEGALRTRTGQFLGKFSFASPEIFLTNAIDWRADVYSIGVIFHRLLTRRSPLRVERTANYYEWVMAHQRRLELDLSAPEGAPAIPDELASVIRRMLAKEPGERPQSYEWIIGALDSIHRELTASGMVPDPATLVNLPVPNIRKTSGYVSPSALDVRPSGADDEPGATIPSEDAPPRPTPAAGPSGTFEPTIRILEEVEATPDGDDTAPPPRLMPPQQLEIPRERSPEPPRAAQTPRAPRPKRRTISTAQSQLVVYGIQKKTGPPLPASMAIEEAVEDDESAARKRIMILFVVASVILVFAAAFLLVWFFLKKTPLSEGGAPPAPRSAAVAVWERVR